MNIIKTYTISLKDLLDWLSKETGHPSEAIYWSLPVEVDSGSLYIDTEDYIDEDFEVYHKHISKYMLENNIDQLTVINQH